MANDFVYAISGFLCNYIKRYIDNIFSSDKSIWLYCIRVDNWLLSVLFGGKWQIQKIFKDKASSLIFCHHYNFVFLLLTTVQMFRGSKLLAWLNIIFTESQWPPKATSAAAAQSLRQLQPNFLAVRLAEDAQIFPRNKNHFLSD